VPPINATSSTTSIRYATALLRGPAAYLEYKFRDDTSLRAHLIRMAVHGVRMIDDSLVPAPSSNDYSLSNTINGMSTWHHLISWFIYDLVCFIKNSKACITEKNTSSVIAKDKDEHECLRGAILPVAEMVCALTRISTTSYDGNNLTDTVMSIVRLCELYYATPHNSAKRTVIEGLLVTCIVEFLVKSKQLYKLTRRRKREFVFDLLEI
jgi:hypothetical protein